MELNNLVLRRNTVLLTSKSLQGSFGPEFVPYEGTDKIKVSALPAQQPQDQFSYFACFCPYGVLPQSFALAAPTDSTSRSKT